MPLRSRPGEWPSALGSLPLVLLFVVPLLALLGTSSWPRLAANLASTEVQQAIGLSLATSLTATGLAVILGTPLAYRLAHREFPGRRLVDTLIDMPMVLPPSVAGIALLLAFGRAGFLGPWLDALGIRIAFTPAAVVLAQLFVSAPYYVRAATLGLAAVDPELQQAAALDGGTTWQVWRHITLPLARNSLLGGAMMCWARALGEFGATIIFAGNLPGWTQTMPLAIYVGFELDLNVAVTLALILLALSFGVLVTVKALLPAGSGSGR